MIQLGILALQGAYREHAEFFARCPEISEFHVKLVRTSTELDACVALVIPGGESTAIRVLASRNDTLDALKRCIVRCPTWGTCAGVILISKQVSQRICDEPELNDLGVMVTITQVRSYLTLKDIVTVRNFYGNQQSSFMKNVTLKDQQPINAVFIRAPHIKEFLDKDKVETVSVLDNGGSEIIVGVRQGKWLGITFHPELNPDGDTRYHSYFLRMIKEHVDGK